MNSSTRRDFLRTVTLGSVSVSAGLLAAGLSPRRIFAAESTGFRRIVYRKLGSTGFLASEVGFGAMNTRDPELIRAALDSGINYIDTAWGYMGGRNEEVVGDVLKGRRDKIFLTTKVQKREPDVMRKQIETSLKRLKTDRLDLLLLHVTNSREEVLNDNYMKVIGEAKKKGMTRFIGVSTHANQAEVVNAAVDSKYWEAVLVGYSYKSPSNVTAALERARKAGLAVIAMKTQNEGKGYPGHKMGDISPNQAALKWVLNNPYVDTAIPGMTAFDQLPEDLAVMEMRMSFRDAGKQLYLGESDVKSCGGVAGCTGCIDKCPEGMAIRELNRCIGYADGYGDIELARENYANLPDAWRVDICSDCDECVVKCVNGLNLNDTVLRARELFT